MPYENISRDNLVVLSERIALPRSSCTPDLRSGGECGGIQDIVGRSAALMGVLQQVRAVAPTDSTVLIQGETGTGKELIAKAIHAQSRRQTCPFVKMNCAAIPRELLESEIFGHEKGSFTGAVARRIGRFEAADQGTLFMDEIGDMPVELQIKLLRVLQEQEFERVGSTATQRVNVRVIAATNQDLDQLVDEKRFRSDLYYRLSVFPIVIPPLRNRRDDIPLLVEHFVTDYARRMDKQIETIPSDAMEALVSYEWPGNIRELQNFIERSVILSAGAVLTPPISELLAKRHVAMPVTMEECERAHILKAVQESAWVIGGPHGAAARLGVPRSTLMYRMRKLAIVKDHREICTILQPFHAPAALSHSQRARGAAQG
jgi:formate hydrogenlyase transcriptional activator